ncbi:TPA: LPXTG cell wall anchor domain-containing protein, partial [Streptococcus suis]|nr:LPXTG cell wall anchor domain-containing protein [Streptococcus suis]
VTIPQTGGIGTLVFTVVGLSVMVFAFIAMKKRQSEEA